MKEKVVRLREKPNVRLRLCVRFLSTARKWQHFGAAVSLFRKSRASGKLRRKRHNAVTPFATGFIAGLLFSRELTQENMKRYFGTMRAAGNSRGAHNKRRGHESLSHNR